MAAISSVDVIQNTCNAPWAVNVEPFRVTEQIWYIGNRWVGAYLIDTGDGVIILDTMCAETAYLMVDAIYKCGFRPTDIKMILLSHGHPDHYGAARLLHEMSGAPIYLSKEDEAYRHNEKLSSAKSANPTNGLTWKFYDFETDCFYDEYKPITLGNITIRTKLTPGHTLGTTSFFITAPQSNGEVLTVAMHGGVGVLTMTDAYFEETGLPCSIRTNFVAQCEELKQEDVDICLASHPAHYPGDFFEIAKQSWENGNPFVNKDAWNAFLTSRGGIAAKM